jgi:nucleotide-binding universal stress UspA family protein
LEDLWRAGAPPQSEAIVISVAELWWPMPESAGIGETRFEEGASHALEKAALLATQASERLRSYFPDWIVKAEADTGSPAQVIIERADDWDPDLIVVGSHGYSALSRIVLGSVSQRIVTEAPGSVRVARGRDGDDQTPVRLLIGIDGSPNAQATLAAVAARVWPANSEARLVIAIDNVVSNVIEYVDGGHSWIHETLEAAGENLRTSGLTVSSQIKKGDPRSILPAVAESWGADCIFVGARGLSRFERFRLGSVSAATAARAHCSVEVARFRR